VLISNVQLSIIGALIFASIHCQYMHSKWFELLM